MKQNDRIKWHLENVGEISSKEAYINYGCSRLSARIWDLRHKYGMNISKTMKTDKNKFQETTVYAVYRLEREHET